MGEKFTTQRATKVAAGGFPVASVANGTGELSTKCAPLFDGENFPLTTFSANQHQRLFPRRLIKLRSQPQPIRTARQTFDLELAERTLARRLRRLIILPTLKIACGIHPRSLPRHTDNRCPSRFPILTMNEYGWTQISVLNFQLFQILASTPVLAHNCIQYASWV
jgi:hypothetical protein